MIYPTKIVIFVKKTDMEDWKFVNESYEISSKGKLRKGNFILKGSIKKTGYLEYSMSVKGKRIYALAQRLVAIHFIPNPENKPEVNHIDFDTLNNEKSNLEWSTRLENIRHSRRNERYPKNISKRSVDTLRKDKDAKRHKMKPVANDIGEIFESVKEAERKYKNGNIHTAIKKGWSCAGMKWKHINNENN